MGTTGSAQAQGRAGGAGGLRDLVLAMRRLALAAIAIVALIAVTTGAPAQASPQGPEASALAETTTPPKVTKQPVNLTVQEGQSASFTSTASGTPTPTIQWERSTDGGASWSAVAGATSSTLTIASAKASEGANKYRAVFTNVAGSATSKVVTLTVQAAPQVTQQPASVTVEEGQNAVFEAGASGSPAPTVKWELSTNGGATWTGIVGATGNQLTITAVKTSLSGRKYRATFKNSIGQATSEAATLTVQNPPVVTKQPASLTVNEGQSAVFEATASGFPAPALQWEISTDGGGSWSAVQGATANQLTIASTVVSEDGHMFRARFQSTAGIATSNVATLTVHAAPLVTHQPASVTVTPGERAAFEATASGFPTPTEQWEVSTDEGSTWSAIAGATGPQYAIEAAAISESGHEYRAVFSNSGGSTASTPALLTVSTKRFAALAWGDNTYRQLGDGFKEQFIDTPTPVTGLRFVTAVAAGMRHGLALLADGTVVAWGANGLGQLGDGATSESSVPVPVKGLSKVTAIAAGASHSLALLKNGTVMAWGYNESGQLGNGSTAESSTVPVAVQGLSGVQAISAGSNFSLALLKNGTVMAWGGNESGQLGVGSTKSSNTPVADKRLTGVTAISAGGEFGLALLSDGTVQGWGSDLQGQLANAAVEEGFSRSPVVVGSGSLSGVSAIAAGENHALALFSGGSVMAWGEDGHGELGNGTVKSHEETPVAVSGLSGVKAISAGSQDSVALLASGSVMTWGNDSSGVLGDGVLGGISAVPVGVTGLGEASAVSAGRSNMLAVSEPIPTVTAVNPNLGPTSGANTVTITGSELAGATAVRFGATPASAFTVESATSITATVPAGSATVDVTVATPAGRSPAGTADRYTYQTLPTVKKLSTKTGPAGGGTVVTVTGTEFTAANQVTFGSVAATSYTVDSPTSITAVAPAAGAGVADVHVTNTDGTSPASLADRFKYVPVVQALAPSSGSTLGGTSVTVSGDGFALGSTATTFKFGATKAKSVDCSSSTTCTVVAPAHEAATVDVRATVNKEISAPAAPGDQFSYG